MNRQTTINYGPFLESVYDRYHRASYLGSDPLVMVRAFDCEEDREIAAIFAALLAYGNVKQINASLARLFSAMGNRPGRFIRQLDMIAARTALAGFKHRFADEDDILCLCCLLHQAQQAGSLGEAFASCIRQDESDLALAAGRFIDYLHSFEFAPHFNRASMLSRSSFKHLMPRADRGSACKRIHLLLRWMIRPDDGIDLGLWPQVLPSLLLVPVDTHIMRLSTNLGLCTRKSASLQFSRDVTAKLRQVDPDDPARFDFSLCRLGILQMCPTRADLASCGECELYDPCQLRRRLERSAARSRPRHSLKR